MVYIESKLVKSTNLGKFLKNNGSFVMIKGFFMYHSPFQHNFRSVPADEVYGGTPAPYDVSVADFSCYEMGLSSGRQRVINKYYNDLDEGPGFFNSVVRKALVLYDPEIYNIVSYMDSRDTLVRIGPVTRKLLNYVTEKSKNVYKCDNMELQYGVYVKATDIWEKTGSYEWRRGTFRLDGQPATFEEVLRRCIKNDSYKSARS